MKLKPILNLTQHVGTPEQGVYDEVLKPILVEQLTFTTLPSSEEIKKRAENLAEIASLLGYEKAMIGGAPYLMSELEKSLKARGIQPLYSFTERVSVETKSPTGEVTKTSVFKHIGWVEV